jgi:hypothetical protein
VDGRWVIALNHVSSRGMTEPAAGSNVQETR